MSYVPAILGIAASPRKESNTSALLDAALDAANRAGAEVKKIHLSNLHMAPCSACNACIGNVRCIIDDDFQEVYDELVSRDRVILAVPVTYMNVNAQAKILIDRCQCFYNRKYVRKERVAKRLRRRRRAALISVCGSRLRNPFAGVLRTVARVFDDLDMPLAESLLVARVDAPGEISKHPEYLESARQLGTNIAAP